MKKIIVIFMTAVLLSFCLSLSAMAAGTEFSLSEDWQTITYNGTAYRRADLSAVSVFFYAELDKQLELLPEQQTQLRDYSFSIDQSKNIIEAEFRFRDGSTLYCGYVSEDLYPALQTAQASHDIPCYIEFYWEDTAKAKAVESRFMGTTTTLSSWQLQSADTYPVYVDHNLGLFQIIKGTLLSVNGRFYYVNHAEVGIYTAYTLDIYEYDTLSCYEITDEALLREIGKSFGSYYSLANGSGSILGIFTVAFWVFIFGILPGAILVLAIVCFCRGKGNYRKVWGLTALFAIGELVLMTVVTVVLLLSM